ncbi:regulatory protein RecX [Humidisolicoccus flavus]|uniref:regulatory protein RecX n=1 Tax=Humidisolicoccus flavus TaxID=3111414 RepID=UPI00324410A5
MVRSNGGLGGESAEPNPVVDLRHRFAERQQEAASAEEISSLQPAAVVAIAPHQAGNESSGRSTQNAAAVPFETNDGERDAEAGPSADEVHGWALRALVRRAMSRTELERALVQKGASPEQASDEADRQVADGVLNDRELAANVSEKIQRSKRYGAGKIRQELRARGVDAEDAAAALAEVEVDESELALELARKRAGQLEGLERSKAMQRLNGFLQRRGFSGDVVRTATETVVNELGLSNQPKYTPQSRGKSTVRFE